MSAEAEHLVIVSRVDAAMVPATEGRRTVYFDGACPLCLMEIGFLRRADRKGRLVFEDVSPPDAQPSCPLPRERLMARFHVRLPDGRMVSGARAFTEAWSALPGLGFLRLIGAFAPTRIALDALYGVFLRVRPAMQRWARRRSG